MYHITPLTLLNGPFPKCFFFFFLLINYCLITCFLFFLSEYVTFLCLKYIYDTACIIIPQTLFNGPFPKFLFSFPYIYPCVNYIIFSNPSRCLKYISYCMYYITLLPPPPQTLLTGPFLKLIVLSCFSPCVNYTQLKGRNS